MFDPNDLHPLPRYGLVAAMYAVSEGKRENFPVLEQEGDYANLAYDALERGRFNFLLAPQRQSADNSKVTYSMVEVDDKKNAPGSKTGRNSANGYFLAPHVLTGNNSGPLVKELYSLRKLVGAGKLDKLYGMKRSFSPLTSKINAGTRSMSDPPDDILSAAFTAIAVTTPYKAAALDYDNFTNAGLVPDLAFYDSVTDSYPLVNYIKVLALMLEPDSSGKLMGNFDEKTKKYSRPNIYYGNYRYAPRSIHIGSVSLFAAFSGWREQSGTAVSAEIITQKEIDQILETLAGRPVYTFGYDANRQETIGIHLAELAKEQILYDAADQMAHVRFFDSPDKLDFSGTKWKMFVRYFDSFLRFFNTTSLLNLLSLRATYPDSFSLIFQKYFIMSKKHKPEIVKSALALGRHLNRAAMFAANKRKEEDKSTNRTVWDYKARVLTELESLIRSSRNTADLLARLATTAGRMSNGDIDSEASDLMYAMLVEGEEGIEVKDAQNLIIAFMRLNHKKPKQDIEESEISEDDF